MCAFVSRVKLVRAHRVGTVAHNSNGVQVNKNGGRHRLATYAVVTCNASLIINTLQSKVGLPVQAPGNLEAEKSILCAILAPNVRHS